IEVTPVNDAPVASDLSATTPEDTQLAGNVTATDVDSPELTFRVVDGPLHGTLVLHADGSFTYLSELNFNGSDGFTFVANDGFLDSEPGTVTLIIIPVNDAPIAQDQAATTNQSTTVAGTLLATDVDGPTLSYLLVTAAANGSVVVNPDGSFTYT